MALVKNELGIEYDDTLVGQRRVSYEPNDHRHWIVEENIGNDAWKIISKYENESQAISEVEGTGR